MWFRRESGDTARKLICLQKCIFEIWSRMGSDMFQFPQIALKAGKHPAIVHALDIGLPGGREMLFGVSLPTQRLLRAFASYIGCGNKDLKSKGPPASPGSICGRSAGARDTKTVYALNSGGPGEGPPKPPPCG